MARQTDALRYEVRRKAVGDEDFAVDTTIEVIKVFESAGGRELDNAELEVNLAEVTTRFADWTSPPYEGDEIEIERTPTSSVVHWGKIVAVRPMLGSDGEVIRLLARLEPYHTGERLDGIWHWDPLIDAPALIDRDLEFNPVVDGKVQGNKHESASYNGAAVFLDPDAARTAASQTLYGATAVSWSLSEAIEYLCWALNPNETNITNPTLASIQAGVDDATAELSGIRLARGVFLSEAFDQLLGPLGYRWRIVRSAGSRTFEFFRRGYSGTIKTVTHQAAGGELDILETTLTSANMSFDLTNTVNQVTAVGDYYQHEITAELLRAWPEAQDSLANGDAPELARSHANFDVHPDAYRKWVLNESGDYIGLRTGIDGVFTSELRTALTGVGLLDDFHPPRRRRLLPTLTLGPDGATPIGRIRGIEVEYSNPNYGESGEPEWLALEDTACELLEHEGGIYLSGERLPEALLLQGESLKVRATFTLESDYRIRATAARQANSPHPDIVPATLEVADRFQYRQVTTLSKYYDDVHGTTPTRSSLEQNDLTAIQNWANATRDNWDLRAVAGRLFLDSLDAHIYEVGQRISQIEGRNVSFVAKEGTTAYPQIVAIERDVEGQQTILHLERFRPANDPSRRRR